MKKLHTIRLIAFLTSLILLIILVGFQCLPLTYSEADWMNRTTAQSMLAQRIAKNALILAYRPNNEHTQAISELQSTLPVWEDQQSRLLGVRSDDLRGLAMQSQQDFSEMDAAARRLLAHSKEKTDLVQVEIILRHEANYTATMVQLSALMQKHIEDFNRGLVLFQNAIAVLLLITVVSHFVLAEREQRKIQSALLTIITILLAERERKIQEESNEESNDDDLQPREQ